MTQLMAMPAEAQYELRAAFYAHRQLLAAFVQENPQRASITAPATCGRSASPDNVLVGMS
jgi:hypothetical protein